MKGRCHIALCSLMMLATAVVVACGDGPVTYAASRQTVQDAAGRTVTLPDPIGRAVTLGPVPVLNSFLMALGKADTIVNGLPLFAQTKRHKYQTIFAPHLGRHPVVQGPGADPDMEALLALRPDVVLTMDPRTAWTFDRKGFNAVVLAWRHHADVEATMMLLGKMFQREQEARSYLEYSDRIGKTVSEAIARVPQSKRPKVLFCSLKTMTQPHLIADWWIVRAGGISVTGDDRTVESVSFSMEHVLKWNPDILIVSTPGEISQVYQDARLRTVSAVSNRRVYSIPAGAHPWGYRTVEQPLAILWAATVFHPELAEQLDLENEMRRFYSRFFHYSLTDEQIQEILSGIP